MKINVKAIGYLSLILTLVIVGVVPLAYKLGSATTSLGFVFLVFLISTIMSFFVMIGRGSHTNIRSYMGKREHLWVFIAIGFFFLAQTFLMSSGTHYVSASLAAVIYRSWPLILILLSPLLLKEKMTKWDFSAVLIGFAGMAIALMPNTLISIPIFAIPYIGIILLAAFVDAFQSGFQKRYQYELSSATFIENLIGLAIITPLALYFGAINIPLSLGILIPALIIGILQNVLLSYLFPLAFRIVKTSIASVTLMFPPFVTMILSYFLLGEPIQLSYLVIAGSVFLGLIVQRFAPKSSTYISKTKVRGPNLYDVSAAFTNTRSKLIYYHLMGEGRVLAFCKHLENETRADKYIGTVKNACNKADCAIFSNKLPNTEIMPDEYALIKDITGHEDNDLVVLGVGKPAVVETSLVEVHKQLSELI